MAVNLLPPDARALAQASVLRRTVYLITTLVLVVYLLIVSGVGGWWLFLSTRKSQLQTEIASLSSQVAQKAAQEVLLRQIGTRIAQIDNSIKTRVNLVDLTVKVTPTEPSLFITSWDFVDSTGKSSFSLTASSSGSIEAYGQRLLSSFTTVDIGSLTRMGSSWVGEVSVGGSTHP